MHQLVLVVLGGESIQLELISEAAPSLLMSKNCGNGLGGGWPWAR